MAEEVTVEDGNPPEGVSQSAFDNAVKHLQNSLSEIRERLDDLERIVSQPQGAITFSEITPDQPPLPLAEEDAGDVPWYGNPW